MATDDYPANGTPRNSLPESALPYQLLVVELPQAPKAPIEAALAPDWGTLRAESRDTALTQVQLHAPDLVLVVAPAIAGLELVPKLKAKAESEGTPLVLVADAGDPVTRTAAYSGGASDYVEAPIEAGELQARIRAQLRAVDQLRLSRSARWFSDRVFSGMSDAVVVLDPDWRYLFASDRVSELVGVPRDQLLGRSITEVFPELRGTPFEPALRTAMTERQSQRVMLDHPPSERVFDVRIYPSQEGVLIFASDITDTLHLEQSLREANHRFRTLAENVSEVFWIFDTDNYRYEYVSPAVETVYGVSPEALYADPDLPRTLIVDHEDWSSFAGARRQEAPPRRRLRFRIRRRDGEEAWVESHSYPYGTSGSRHPWICGVTVDVTDQVERERQLREARDALSEHARNLDRRLRLLIDSTREYAIYMLNANGEIVTWNLGAERLKGYPADEIIGQHVSIFYPQSERALGRPESLLETARIDGSVETEGWRLNRDGSRFWAQVTITAVFDERGEHLGYGKVVRDLTDRHRAEQQQRALMEELQHRSAELESAKEQLEHYGRELQALTRKLQAAQEEERRALSRELHDDIGQRLFALRLQLIALERGELEQPEAVDSALEQIEGVVERSREIMANLRPSELDELGLVPALRRLVNQQGKASGVHVEFHCETQRPAFGQDVDTALFRMAQEAMANAIRHSGCSHLTVSLTCLGDAVRLDVQDDGRGFEVEQAQHRGSTHAGFGLLSMRERANVHGGELTVDTRPGEGTTISVRLPA